MKKILEKIQLFFLCSEAISISSFKDDERLHIRTEWPSADIRSWYTLCVQLTFWLNIHLMKFYRLG